MNSQPNYEQVVKLAKELKELLENHLLENPEIAAPFIERAKNVREEIERMGLLVIWKTSLDTKAKKACVEIEVLKPKENMTPKEQKLYDEWLLKRAGISLDTEN